MPFTFEKPFRSDIAPSDLSQLMMLPEISNGTHMSILKDVHYTHKQSFFESIIANKQFALFGQRQKNMDYGVNSYSGYDQPIMISMWRNQSGRNYLEIYPPVTSDKQMTIYGFVQINPRTYDGDALSANIPLQQEYEPSIKEFAKYKIYKRSKNEKENASEAFATFDMYNQQMLVNLPVKAEIEITYH